MWRLPLNCRLLRRSIAGVQTGLPTLWPWRNQPSQPLPTRTCARLSSTGSSAVGGGGDEESMTFAEAKRLMKLANVEALKRRLEMENEEVIGYSKLLEACEGMGVARNKEEARAFARVLDEAGVVLLFRDQVYLHPEKELERDEALLGIRTTRVTIFRIPVLDLIRRAVPLLSSPENDPWHEELKKLQKKKEEIDLLAHKQVRCILWSGLGFSIGQVVLFFRLTFWEFSWDVMEPVAFFTTAAGILVGYAYFLFTSKDPTYQDLMKRLFLSRQRKLLQKKNFDMERFMELQRHFGSPLEHHTVMMGAVKLQRD